jgi:hypothetical protein
MFLNIFKFNIFSKIYKKLRFSYKNYLSYKSYLVMKSFSLIEDRLSKGYILNFHFFFNFMKSNKRYIIYKKLINIFNFNIFFLKNLINNLKLNSFNKIYKKKSKNVNFFQFFYKNKLEIMLIKNTKIKYLVNFLYFPKITKVIKKLKHLNKTNFNNTIKRYSIFILKNKKFGLFDKFLYKYRNKINYLNLYNFKLNNKNKINNSINTQY